jgi:hypothetical protein
VVRRVNELIEDDRPFEPAPDARHLEQTKLFLLDVSVKV